VDWPIKNFLIVSSVFWSLLGNDYLHNKTRKIKWPTMGSKFPMVMAKSFNGAISQNTPQIFIPFLKYI
jgi:hypothetical protein